MIPAAITQPLQAALVSPLTGDQQGMDLLSGAVIRTPVPLAVGQDGIEIANFGAANELSCKYFHGGIGALGGIGAHFLASDGGAFSGIIDRNTFEYLETGMQFDSAQWCLEVSRTIMNHVHGHCIDFQGEVAAAGAPSNNFGDLNIINGHSGVYTADPNKARVYLIGCGGFTFGILNCQNYHTQGGNGDGSVIVNSGGGAGHISVLRLEDVDCVTPPISNDGYMHFGIIDASGVVNQGALFRFFDPGVPTNFKIVVECVKIPTSMRTQIDPYQLTDPRFEVRHWQAA